MAIEVPVWLQGGTYPARLDRALLARSWDEGVTDLGSLRVTQRGAGANMSVDVSAGSVFVAGDDEPHQGTYHVRSTAVENRTIGTAPGSGTRIDRVVVRVNDPNAGGPAGDDATIVVLAGTPSSSPTPPAEPATAVTLALVVVPAGKTSIVDADIIDARPLAGRVDTPGVIVAYAGGPVPNGWLLCDGSTPSRAAYPRLNAHLAAIGYPYGDGDGVTTFGLPNLTGRVAVHGAGSAFAVGSSGGSPDATLPAHTHSINHGHSATIASGGAHSHSTRTKGTSPLGFAAQPNLILNLLQSGPQNGWTNSTYASFGSASASQLVTDEAAAHSHTATVSSHSGSSGSAGSSATGANMPPYLAVHGYIIRT